MDSSCAHSESSIKMCVVPQPVPQAVPYMVPVVPAAVPQLVLAAVPHGTGCTSCRDLAAGTVCGTGCGTA